MTDSTNPLARNLRPYQWQIGQLIFGTGTPYDVLGVKIDTYNVNNQDFQLPFSNETRMGIDTEQAGPITFTLGVRDNAPVRHLPNRLPTDLITKSARLLPALQSEWKATDVKTQWGQLKPLLYCTGYGSVRRIYGRPRKFTYTAKTRTSSFYKVQAEYARIDSLTYSDTEYVAIITPGAAPVAYTRDDGDVDSWFRVLLTGPMTNPIVHVGANTIQLQTTIAAGVTVEVSSYPWARRIIDTTGTNLRTALIGDTRYLDQLQIPPTAPQLMSATATATTAASSVLVLWRDAYTIV